MKCSIVLLGLVFCLCLPGQAQTTRQSAQTTQVAANGQQPPAPEARQQPASQAEQSLTVTGCVDERNGHYVLRDEQSGQLLSLQAPGENEDTWFARFVGHKAQASGTKSSETLSVTSVKMVADMCGPARSMASDGK